MNRQMHEWDVTLVDANRQTKQVVFRSYWNPHAEGMAEVVGEAAASQATYNSSPGNANLRTKHAAIEVKYREPEPVAA